MALNFDTKILSFSIFGVKAVEEDLVHLVNVLEVDQCRVGLVLRFDFGLVVRETESVCERFSFFFFFFFRTCVCENLDYELMVMGSIFYYFLWFWIDFVWFGAHQLSVKLARPTRCELCDATSYIGLLWFLRIWFKLFLILKNFDGLYICNFFFFYLLWKFAIFFELCF